MIILVAVTFVLCWTPFYTVTTITQLQTDSFLRHSQFLFTMLAIHWAGFSSSAANPLIYAAMSYQFRRSFKQVRASGRRKTEKYEANVRTYSQPTMAGGKRISGGRPT